MEIKVVWITMLALKDNDGRVICSLPGLAHQAGVGIDSALEAIEKFKKPDPYSTTKENEGRRIEDIDGGWFILNQFKYLEMLSIEDRRAYWAMKKREARARGNSLTRKLKKRESEHMARIGETEETMDNQK